MGSAKFIAVKAGKYYLGDPCYVVPDRLWSEFCDKYFADENSPVVLEGKEVIAFSTKNGDGTYSDQYGKNYPVDAGLIGLTAVELYEQKGDETEPFGCRLVEVSNGIICESDGSVLSFGEYVIDTDEQSFYDDDDDEPEEYDDTDSQEDEE